MNRSVEVRVHYENDGNTSWVCCFCLLRDGAKGQVYEEEEDLLCNGDLHSCVSDNHDFGLSQRESLITTIRLQQSLIGEAVMPAVTDDDVIKQSDAQQLAGLF